VKLVQPECVQVFDRWAELKKVYSNAIRDLFKITVKLTDHTFSLKRSAV